MTKNAGQRFSRLCLSGEIVHIPTVMLEEHLQEAINEFLRKQFLISLYDFYRDVFINAYLCQQEDIFRAVVTKDAFRSLSVDTQDYLKRFLPKYDGSVNDEEKVLDTVFSASPNVYFGNPVEKFLSKLRQGLLNPVKSSDQAHLRDNRRVLYDHYIRHYYMTVFKSALISRNKELTKLASSSPSGKLTINKLLSTHSLRKSKITKRIKWRTQARLKLQASKYILKIFSFFLIILDRVREEAGDNADISSDEEEFGDSNKIPMTRAGQSTLFSPNFTDYDLHQPVYMDDVKRMLKDYKNLKEEKPDSPSLDISGICIEDVYERAGVACIAERNLSAEVSEAMKLPFKSLK
ncbi:unnamed protein product [Thelazia callipaeda]|uniref:RGS domain-containing protein n=1 Tax=Thelazia callipaeda TaxID=103827 RepID=A0A0N5CV41_THECL|nr:unnamed protein product [Thelazia callipaeda]